MTDDTRAKRGSTPPFGYQSLGREAEDMASQLRTLKAQLALAQEERDQAIARERQLAAQNAELRGRYRDDLVIGLQLSAFHKASTAMALGDVNGLMLVGNRAAEAFLGDVCRVSVFSLLLDHMESPIATPTETTGVLPMPRPYGHDLWERFWKLPVPEGHDRVVHERVKVRSPLDPSVPYDVSFIMKEIRNERGARWVLIEIIPYDHLNRDELTGLYRREVAINKIMRGIGSGEELAGRPRPVAVVGIDLDDFKRYNTNYGYDGGNAVLRRVSAALLKAVRPSDLVVRWFSGDEFVIVLDGGAEVAEDVSERVQRAFASIDVGLTELETGRKVREKVTASIGWSVHELGDTWKSLTDRAFEAASVSKRDGKARVTGSFPRNLREIIRLKGR